MEPDEEDALEGGPPEETPTAEPRAMPNPAEEASAGENREESGDRWLKKAWRNVQDFLILVLTPIADFVGWLWLMRISILGLLVLFGLPYLAHRHGRALVIGAYDLRSSTYLGRTCTGLLLVLLAWSVYVAGMLVVSYGKTRVDYPAKSPRWAPIVLGIALRVLVVCGLCYNLSTLYLASQPCQFKIGAWVFVGMLIGAGVIFAVERVHRAITTYETDKAKEEVRDELRQHDFYFFHRPRAKENSLLYRQVKSRRDARQERAANKNAIHRVQPGRDARQERAADKNATIASLQRGYVTQDWEEGHYMLPGFGLALLSMLVALLIYLVMEWYGLRYANSKHLTAIVYVILLAIFWVWFLSMLTFALDRFRIPVLLIVFALIGVSNCSQRADHFYQIWPAAVTAGNGNGTGGGAIAVRPAITAAELLEDATRKHRNIILVAAAGGGIQSAAWTARVLTGLDEKCGGYGKFSSTVQLMSGVSGGSVGIMYFAQGYDAQHGLPGPRVEEQSPGVTALSGTAYRHCLEGIVDAAMDTSLGQTTLGLVTVDLQRAFLALCFQGSLYLDRGEMMQKAWVVNAKQHMPGLGDSLERASLRQWQEETREGTRPAVIFNATANEAGVRMAYSTSVPSRVEAGADEFCMDGTARSAQGDFSTYPGADIAVTTAARLSATFPYVSPQARPCVARSATGAGILSPAPGDPLNVLIPNGGAGLHVGDGGYFDNSGVVALVNWLDDGLTALGEESEAHPDWKIQMPGHILVIQIEAFPDGTIKAAQNPAPAVGNPAATAPSQAGAKGGGTVFQGIAPLTTLLDVRGTGHIAFANSALEMLVTRWERDPKHSVQIQRVRIVFPLITGKPGSKRGWADAQPDNPPLSWHLRQPEQCAIRNAWKAMVAAEPGYKAGANLDWTTPELEPIEKVQEFVASGR